MAELMLLEKIFDVPKSYYYTFYLEEKWGYNKMTLKTFIKDLVKTVILSIVFQAIIFSAILWIIQTCGDNLIFYLSVLVIGFILLM